MGQNNNKLGAGGHADFDLNCMSEQRMAEIVEIKRQAAGEGHLHWLVLPANLFPLLIAAGR